MPHYELTNGTSKKFWEIELEGSAFTTHWGRLGTKGQSKTVTFEGGAVAKREYDKLVASKVKKGYSLVGSAAPPAGPAAVPPTVVTVRLESPPSIKGMQWRELTLKGDVLKQTTGVVGKHDPPQISREQHASAVEAAEMLERLVVVYGKRGFTEVSRRTEVPAPGHLEGVPPSSPSSTSRGGSS